MKQFLLFSTTNYLSCWRNYIIYCSTISIKEGLKRSTDVEKRRKMHLNVFFNALSLCFLNVSFMIVGMFLNSVVIISLWRSSCLRKEMCYFMTLVLSCFDLAVVTITHPVLILSTILWSMQMYEEEIDHTNEHEPCLRRIFNVCAVDVEYRTIPGPNHPIFSQNKGHKRKTNVIYGIADDYTSRFSAVLLFQNEHYW